jgi:hypothetical protein
VSAVCGGVSAADTGRPDTWPSGHPAASRFRLAAADTAHGGGWRPLPQPAEPGRTGRPPATACPRPAQGCRSVRGGQCRPDVRSRRPGAAGWPDNAVACVRRRSRPPDTAIAGGRPQTPRTPACCGTAPPQRSGRTAGQLRRGHPREPGSAALASVPLSVEVPGNLGAVEQRRKLHSVGTPWYGQSGRGGYVSVVLTRRLPPHGGSP